MVFIQARLDLKVKGLNLGIGTYRVYVRGVFDVHLYCTVLDRGTSALATIV